MSKTKKKQVLKLYATKDEILRNGQRKLLKDSIKKTKHSEPKKTN